MKINHPISLVKPTFNKKALESKARFNDLFIEQINKEKLKFSKHAEVKLQTRNIHLSETQLRKMDEAVAIAKQKNIKDTLILMDNMAFVVNIKNKVVITAMDDKSMEERVFTNIDGTIII